MAQPAGPSSATLGLVQPHAFDESALIPSTSMGSHAIPVDSYAGWGRPQALLRASSDAAGSWAPEHPVAEALQGDLGVQTTRWTSRFHPFAYDDELTSSADGADNALPAGHHVQSDNTIIRPTAPAKRRMLMADLEDRVRARVIQADKGGRYRDSDLMRTTVDPDDVFWLRGPRVWEPSEIAVVLFIEGLKALRPEDKTIGNSCPRGRKCPAVVARVANNAPWPKYNNPKSFIQHVMRCAPLIACVLCGQKHAFFNRAENAEKHRRERCAVARSLEGDECPETIYAWLEVKDKGHLITEPQLGHARENLGVQLCLIRDLINQGDVDTMNTVSVEMVYLIDQGLA